MTFFRWSKTAANNATADTTAPFPEGMSPSAVNDSSRGMMAAAAKYRDDVGGAIVTGGTLNAYTVASFQVFDTLANLSGQLIAFTPHATNGDTVTLNVDGLGAKPLRSAPGVELVAGTLVLGTPYIALYNNSDGAFYLRGYVSSPYNVPFLGGLDFWDTVAPNSTFIFPVGQAISRTVYSRAFARWGGQFGSGDGSTTFNVPDLRGRVAACLDNMGGVTANRLLTGSMAGARHTLGGAGGLDTHTLTVGELAPHTHSGTTAAENASHNHNFAFPSSTSTGATVNGGASLFFWTGSSSATTGTENQNHAHAFTTDSGAGISGSPHDNLQPTILCNYIIRIL